MNLLNIPPAEKEEELIQVAEVIYHNSVVPIFTIFVEGKSTPQFYFHPLVLLDPKSIIVNESSGFFKQEFVRFTVQMWNQELRSKVIECLRSLPSLKDNEIKEEDVQVMGYEEVQLVFNPDNNVRHESIKLMDRPTPYYPHLSEMLDFYLFCDSSSSVQSLAKDLRWDPKFCLRSLRLVLECRGLVVIVDNVEKAQVKRPVFSFNLFTYASADMNSQGSPFFGQKTGQERGEKWNKELEIESLMITSTNWTNPIPVFKVHTCVDARTIGFTFTFINSDLGTINTKYGDYHAATGIFTVKIAGLYQFRFDALQQANNVNHFTHIELRVDGVKAAEFLSQTARGKRDYEPIALSATLPVRKGQRVGVYLAGGRRYATSSTYRPTFSGFIFPHKETV